MVHISEEIAGLPDLHHWAVQCKELEEKQREVDQLKATFAIDCLKEVSKPVSKNKTKRHEDEVAKRVVIEDFVEESVEVRMGDTQSHHVTQHDGHVDPRVIARLSSSTNWNPILNKQRYINERLSDLKRLVAKTIALRTYRGQLIGWCLQQMHVQVMSVGWADKKRRLVNQIEKLQRREDEISDDLDKLEAKSTASAIKDNIQKLNPLKSHSRAHKRKLLEEYSQQVETSMTALERRLSYLEKSPTEHYLAEDEWRERKVSHIKTKGQVEQQQELERDAAMDRPYLYDSLGSPSHIRLLKLHSGYVSKITNDYCKTFLGIDALHETSDYVGDIVCSLHTFDLSDDGYPQFEALSYEWNATQPNVDLWRERSYLLIRSGESGLLQSINVSNSLFNFLKHIRNPEEDIWIWADAVCIDQKNLEERGQQVKIMGQVYSRAERVLAFMPVRSPEGCIESLKHLRTIAAKSTLDTEDMLPYMKGDRKPFDDRVLQLTYWTRKWIIQEIVLARTVVLVIGEHEFPMQDLEDSLARFEEIYMSTPNEGAAAVRSWPIAKLASHRRNRRLSMTHPQMLCNLLLTYGDNKCKEMSDHVYALYNLVDNHREHLKVEYGQDRLIWFIGVLRFLDQHEHAARSTMMSSALLLLNIIKESNFFDARFSPETLAMQVTVSAIDRGSLVHRGDNGYTRILRDYVKSLHPGIRWTLHGSNSLWTVDEKDHRLTEPINNRVLRYFEIHGQRICGLAAARIEDGDHLWQFPNLELAFIVRVDDPEYPGRIRILGRCYVFELRDVDTTKMPPPRSIIRLDEVSTYSVETQCYDLRLNLSDLFGLAYSASDTAYIDGARENQMEQPLLPFPA